MLVDYPQTLLIHVHEFTVFPWTDYTDILIVLFFVCVTLRWPYTIGPVRKTRENANHYLGTIRCLLNRSIYWYSIRDRVSSVQSILPEVQVSVL